MGELHRPLAAFLRMLDGREHPLSMQELIRIVRQAGLSTRELVPFIRFEQAACASSVIFHNNVCEACCMCWLKGQRSAIHDHRGSNCCLQVVQGVLTNTDYQRDADGQLHPAGTMILSAGDWLARQDREIHQVANEQPDGESLITLHVYSPPLSGQRTFSAP